MLRDLRKNYEYGTLDEKEILNNPFDQFEKWLRLAIESDQQEPTAMILSTVDKDLQPHSRMVLLKEFTYAGFVFYTNYTGHKAQQIANNNRVALAFFWPSLERQVRIEGSVKKVNEAVSTHYFHSRPIESQLSAWASPQSQVIPSHEYLEEQVKLYKKKFGDNVPKPSHWGGYIVQPNSFEFWQGRQNRLHDRFLFKMENGDWKISRLAP
jgi:pyridoxamine 5'-phosphate oxidase